MVAGCTSPLAPENFGAREDTNAPSPAPQDANVCRGDAVCVCDPTESRVVCLVRRKGFAVGGGAGSRSALVTSTGGLSGVEEFEGERCIHLPFTPSTALKKLADPAATVRATASRAGANCCSSFSSWIPSCKRRPISATTDTFSLHGCLRLN